MYGRDRRRFGRRGRRGVSNEIAAILLVAITIVLMLLIYAIHIPLPVTPPNVTYIALVDQKYPVWGDPTDCRPVLPYDWEYYLANGTTNATNTARYETYIHAWDSECEDGDTGIYNLMNATRIVINAVTQPIPLSALEFEFICSNSTPTPITTYLVQGPLNAMEWVPGGAGNLTTLSPKLGTCATFDPRGDGADAVYYNRLGFFDPLNATLPDLAPGQSIVIYLHTANSVYEAPNPLAAESSWNLPDEDDYHGAPPWCFTTPGACTVELVDTDFSPAIVVLQVPLFLL